MYQGSSMYAFSGTAQSGSNRSSIILRRAGTGDPAGQMTDTHLEVRCGSSSGDANHDSNYNSVIVFANGNVT